ncbi:hypothetical protein MMC34_003271 [Xylographa carneopallida]|nr:hypothetical protein [Xylographa carneopallida]
MNGTLSYGLNIRKKDPLSRSRRAPPPTRKPIFDDGDGSDGEDGSAPTAEEAITTIGGLSIPSQSTNTSNTHQSLKLTSIAKPPPARKVPYTTTQYGDLTTNHTTALHANSSLDLDSSIYDYDSVYDSLHAKPPTSSSTGLAGPKYMGNLLAAAEVRKRDQLRAKEKMLAKERDAEGDDYAGKEKFVTGAYKAQQEEVRRMEAEEVRREIEDAERRRKQGGGMVGLYRGMLERDEKRHEEMVKAAAEEEGKGARKVETTAEPRSESELAREKGATLNDDGVVVDKRQLLSAGLNVAAKPKAPASALATDAARSAARSGGASTGMQGPRAAKMAQRERQTRMLEAQLEEATKRAADDEDVQRKALERAAKSRKTEGDISGARQRYLDRKKAAAAAAAAGAEG